MSKESESSSKDYIDFSEEKKTAKSTRMSLAEWFLQILMLENDQHGRHDELLLFENPDKKMNGLDISELFTFTNDYSDDNDENMDKINEGLGLSDLLSPLLNEGTGGLPEEEEDLAKEDQDLLISNLFSDNQGVDV